MKHASKNSMSGMTRERDGKNWQGASSAAAAAHGQPAVLPVPGVARGSSLNAHQVLRFGAPHRKLMLGPPISSLLLRQVATPCCMRTGRLLTRRAAGRVASEARRTSSPCPVGTEIGHGMVTPFRARQRLCPHRRYPQPRRETWTWR